MVRNEGGEESISPSSAITQQTRFRTSSSAYHRWQGVSVGGEQISLCSCCRTADKLWGQFSHALTLRAGSPIPLPSVLLCGPSEVQVRGRTISPALVTPLGPTFSACHPWQGQKEEERISPSLMPLHSRYEAGLALPHSCPCTWLNSNPHIQSQLFCAAQVRVRASSPTLMTPGQLSCCHR